jgi:hypothetical protein
MTNKETKNLNKPSTNTVEQTLLWMMPTRMSSGIRLQKEKVALVLVPQANTIKVMLIINLLESTVELEAEEMEVLSKGTDIDNY